MLQTQSSNVYIVIIMYYITFRKNERYTYTYNENTYNRYSHILYKNSVFYQLFS